MPNEPLFLTLSIAFFSVAQRRMMSTAEPSLAKTWLSDPATYPIIGVLLIACTGAASFIGYKFTQCPDVRITGGHKNEVVRTWG